MEISQALAEGPQVLRILTVGKTGVGKSSLVNAILGEDIFEENFGSQPGTTDFFQYGQKTINGVVVYGYDSMGFFDGKVDQESIIDAIDGTGCDFDIVLVCMKFSDRFDDANKKMFHVLSHLKVVSNICSKVVIALTHSDIISPDWKDEEVCEKVEKEYHTWSKSIQEYLASNIPQMKNAPIKLTTHSKVVCKYPYLDKWLPDLLVTLAEEACTTPEAIYALAATGERNIAYILEATAAKVGRDSPKTQQEAKNMFSDFFALANGAPEILDDLKSKFLQKTCISSNASDTITLDTSTDDTVANTSTDDTVANTSTDDTASTNAKPSSIVSPQHSHRPPSSKTTNGDKKAKDVVGAGVVGGLIGGATGSGAGALIVGGAAVVGGGVIGAGIGAILGVGVVCLWLWKKRKNKN